MYLVSAILPREHWRRGMQRIFFEINLFFKLLTLLMLGTLKIWTLNEGKDNVVTSSVNASHCNLEDGRMFTMDNLICNTHTHHNTCENVPWNTKTQRRVPRECAISSGGGQLRVPRSAVCPSASPVSPRPVALSVSGRPWVGCAVPFPSQVLRRRSRASFGMCAGSPPRSCWWSGRSVDCRKMESLRRVSRPTDSAGTWHCSGCWCYCPEDLPTVAAATGSGQLDQCPRGVACAYEQSPRRGSSWTTSSTPWRSPSPRVASNRTHLDDDHGHPCLCDFPCYFEITTTKEKTNCGKFTSLQSLMTVVDFDKVLYIILLALCSNLIIQSTSYWRPRNNSNRI